MLKIFIILLVIISHSILSTKCDDIDEFAEFEADFGPSITVQDPTSNIKSNDARPKSSAGQHTPLGDPDSSSKNENVKDRLNTDKQNSQTSDESKDDIEDDTNADQSNDKTKKPDLKLVIAPSTKQYRLESYYIETAFLLATFLYLVNFFVGSAKNLKFAQSWYEQSRELLKSQFVLVGGAPTIEDGSQKRDEDTDAYLASLKKQRGLIKASDSLFTIWSSGRVGLEGLLIEINLLKRQDLFSMALNLLKATKDNITFRFALSAEGYENFVFCIAHKTQAARLVRDMVDINTFCPKRKPLSQYGYDIDKLYVMSELSDVVSYVLDQKTVDFLKRYEKAINHIHITDHFSNDRSDDISPMKKLAHSKRIASFSFNFPTNDEERQDFIMFSLSLIDRLRRFKLARDSKQKSEKNRQKITDYLQKAALAMRQEAAAAKKDELRRLEKERIYNEDDPEKQRRWEKKEAKRDLKKSKLRVKQLRVKSM